MSSSSSQTNTGTKLQGKTLEEAHDLVPRKAMKTREEYLQEKALEEARKLGQAEPEVDEEGQMINPHIPAYIAKAPWYLSTGAPTLKHQRLTLSKGRSFGGIDDDVTRVATGEEKFKWYRRRKQTRKGPVATTYREGACANCGAMTHKTKDCVERPRRRGAKVANRSFARDEDLFEEEELDLGFEGKRDRWNGFDPAEYRKVVERYKEVEAQRRKIKSRQLDEKLTDLKTQRERTETKVDAGGSEDGGADQGADGEKGEEDAAKKALRMAGFESDDDSSDYESSDDDEDKIAENIGMTTVANVTDKRSQSVRNLRIREDTAKYLLNLDVDSAYYDPKTRSMRENPNPDDEDASFKGDAASMYTEEYARFAELQKFAFDAGERGQDVHFVAMPSQSELLYKEYKGKRERLKEKQKQQILESYGGAEHLVQPTEGDDLLSEIGMESERYVEYSRSGRVVSGKRKAVPKSKYEEDVFIHGHTAVWGSYWNDGKWGYACCRSHDRDSICANSSDMILPSIAVEAGDSTLATSAAAKSTERGAMPPPPPLPVATELPADEKEEKASGKHGEHYSLEQLKQMTDKERERDHERIRQELMAELIKQKQKKQESSNTDSGSSRDKHSGKRTLSGESDREPLLSAIQQQEQQNKMRDRKRPRYNSQQDVSSAVTQEELDEYRMRKHSAEDPMKDYLSHDH